MDFQQIVDIASGIEVFNLFFKVFSVVFSILYLIYSLVIYKQTQVMTRTLISDTNPIILSFALVQIIIGVLLFTVSLLVT